MTTALATLTKNFAARFGIESNQQELIDTLKATAFKGGSVSDAQMTALMLVAQQFNLNPWTREIYAFPDKGGIVPVVGVDGWSRIMNDHQQFDGMEFKFEDDSCTCTIYRKDRSHPVSATEYLSECRRDNSPAWKSHPRRMLRHKAMIQAARLAFGFGGIFDQDEAERIVEVKGETIDNNTGEIVGKREAKPEPLSQEIFDAQSASWKKSIVSGKKTTEALVLWINAKGALLTDSQKSVINSWKPEEIKPAENMDSEPEITAIDPTDIPFN